MFFVLNKEKVCAYIVSVITVCCLFGFASLTTENEIETSTNISNTINNLNLNNIVK